MRDVDDRLTVHQLEPRQVITFDACDAIVARFTGLKKVGTDGERLLIGTYGVLPPGVVIVEAATAIGSGEGIDRIAAVNVERARAVTLLEVCGSAEPRVVRL